MLPTLYSDMELEGSRANRRVVHGEDDRHGDRAGNAREQVPTGAQSGVDRGQDFATNDINLQYPRVPDSGTAITDFNSLPAHAPPFRDVPSIIIAHLIRPIGMFYDPEPDWARFLSYFVNPQASHGLSNLQDLFILIVRVVLPNEIIRNKALMDVFLARFPYRGNPPHLGLRYDAWDQTLLGQVPIEQIPVVLPSEIGSQEDPILSSRSDVQPRAIFRSTPTPDGAQFLHWLSSAALPVPGIQHLVPVHRPSAIDAYLSIPEERIRSFPIRTMLRLTGMAMSMFWWVSRNNQKLGTYMANGWVGVAAEFETGRSQ